MAFKRISCEAFISLLLMSTVCGVGGQLQWDAVNTLNGYEYAVSSAFLTLDAARASCRAEGARLASITSAEENAFLAEIASLKSSFGVYIGLHRGSLECSCEDESVYTCEQCRQSWVWDDGTPMTYMNWGNTTSGQEPQSHDCGILFPDKGWKWADFYCSGIIISFICKRPAQCDDLQTLVCDGQMVKFDLTASGEYSRNLSATSACLDHHNSWADANKAPGPHWIRVTLNGTYNIYSVITQGGGTNLYYVTSYEIQYSTVGENDLHIRDNNNEIIQFSANTDWSSTKVENVLPDVIQATSLLTL